SGLFELKSADHSHCLDPFNFLNPVHLPNLLDLFDFLDPLDNLDPLELLEHLKLFNPLEILDTPNFLYFLNRPNVQPGCNSKSDDAYPAEFSNDDLPHTAQVPASQYPQVLTEDMVLMRTLSARRCAVQLVILAKLLKQFPKFMKELDTCPFSSLAPEDLDH
ncbi:hypothetical protein ACLMJK_009282, partial [Lecanora helva]